MTVAARPRVWIVEDSALEADAAVRALQGECEVTRFPDGPSMLEQLTQSPPPDVVRLDWHLPVMSGIDICQFLRHQAGLRDLGILIVTGVYSKTPDLVQGLAAGANDYVVKPYAAAELAARVGALVRTARLRERAARAEQTLRAVLEELPDALIAVDSDEQVQYINREAARILGDNGDTVGRALRQVAPALSELPARPTPLDALRLGDRVYAPATRTLSLDDRGPLTIISLRDITEARQQLEARDQFLAMLAHELRNPLAPLRTALDLLKRQPAPEASKRPRDIMERQVTRLVRLVDDLLDISRITRGQIELQRQPVDLAGILARAIEDTQPLLDAQRHELVVDFEEAPLTVDGDAVRLEQVFTNLLNNAAKYTPPGGQLRLEARRQQGDIVVRVEDNGIGIDKAMLPRIFDLFFQAETSLARSRGGLGIGLTLVKQLTTLHGASVDAESLGEGKGSVFTVRLPATSQPPAEVAAPTPRRPPEATRILIVDDNDDAAELLSAALSGRGHEVDVVSDGSVAIERALAFKPRVVLLDIGLPGIDGYEVARRLRQQPTLISCRIIGVTGYGQEQDRRLSREAGFDEHLVKPIDLDALWSLLGGDRPKQ